MSDERTVLIGIDEGGLDYATLWERAKGLVGKCSVVEVTIRPVPERRIYEVEVRKPKKGERTLCNDGSISLAAADLTTPWPVILSERRVPAPAPAKRRVRKLELRQRRKGDKYMLCNEYTAEYDLDGLVWVIVEETEEER